MCNLGIAQASLHAWLSLTARLIAQGDETLEQRLAATPNRERE
jgi:hypothetical protein